MVSRAFGSTWWGRAWVSALEDAASLDPSRLGRGRTYARNGSVGPLEFHPGYVTAQVIGNHGRIYRTDIALRTLGPAEWEQVVDAIAARAGHAAALLDGELDPEIIDDAESCDIRLLPGSGDIRPDCTCPDWAEPCKHAAALCYLVANELDRDPFVLFLLRGLRRDDLLSMIRARRLGEDVPPLAVAESMGVDAADAWAGRGLDQPLDPLPEGVAHASTAAPGGFRPPPSWDIDLFEATGIRSRHIDELATDAAARAWAMLADGAGSELDESFEVDLARRAATMERIEADQLARELGWPPQRMGALAEAWARGGSLGVRMVIDDDSWSTDQAALAAAREVLVELGYSRRSVSLNYDSLRMRDNVWIALGPDGRWFKLQAKGKRMELHLVEAPSADITDLVDPPPPR